MKCAVYLDLHMSKNSSKGSPVRILYTEIYYNTKYDLLSLPFEASDISNLWPYMMKTLENFSKEFLMWLWRINLFNRTRASNFDN